MNLRTCHLKSNNLKKKWIWKMGCMHKWLWSAEGGQMTKSNKKNKEYNLQGQLSRSRCWFDLDHNRLKENFMPREPYFYRKMYQIKFMGDDKKVSQIFGVPICNAKITRKLQFHPAAPLIKYHQKTYNSRCLSSLASAFHCAGDKRAVTSLVIALNNHWP